MEMKYCPHCGQMNEKDAKFCVHCGGAQEYVVPGQNVAKGMEQFGKEVSSSVQDLTQRVQTNENIQKGMSEVQIGWTYFIDKIKYPNADYSEMPRGYSIVIFILLAVLPAFPALSLSFFPIAIGISFLYSTTIIMLIFHSIIVSITYLTIKMALNPLVKFSEILKEYTALLSPLVVFLSIITISNLLLGTVQLVAFTFVFNCIFIVMAINNLLNLNYPEENENQIPLYYINVIVFAIIAIILIFVVSIIGDAFIQKLMAQIIDRFSNVNFFRGW